jgi:hypothetical protein
MVADGGWRSVVGCPAARGGEAAARRPGLPLSAARFSPLDQRHHVDQRMAQCPNQERRRPPAAAGEARPRRVS